MYMSPKTLYNAQESNYLPDSRLSNTENLCWSNFPDCAQSLESGLKIRENGYHF